MPALTGTVHATPSLATFELLIGPATSRVFARLPPGSVQAAAGPDAVAPGAMPGGFTWAGAVGAGPLGGAVGAVTLCAVPAVHEGVVLPPPQPPAARLAATASAVPATAGHRVDRDIRLPCGPALMRNSVRRAAKPDTGSPADGS